MSTVSAHPATEAMLYLIDSDIMVDVTRGNRAAADYLDSLVDAWSISTITCLELLAGARTQRETDDLHMVLSGYRTIPTTERMARRAYDLMRVYARSHGLHPMDAMIAGTAMGEGLTLVSKNRKHFHMIAGLELETPEY